MGFLEEMADEPTALPVFNASLRAAPPDDGDGQGQGPVYRLVESRAFNAFIFLCIFVNSIILALERPQAPEKTHPLATAGLPMGRVQQALLLVFSVELALGLVAYGPRRSFGDSWFRLDVIIVVAGWFSVLFPNFANFTILRTLRILRPLRSVRTYPNLKVTVNTMLQSLWPMSHVMALGLIVFLVWGVVALDAFAGTLQQHCFVRTAQGWRLDEDADGDGLRTCGGYYHCGEGSSCFIHGPSPSNNLTYPNPLFDIIQFNDIGHVALTLFTSITLEGWSDVMYLTQNGYHYAGATFFWCSFVLIGSLFVLELSLCVVCEKFASTHAVAVVAAQDKQDSEAAAALATRRLGGGVRTPES